MSANPCILYDATTPLLSQTFTPSSTSLLKSSGFTLKDLIDRGVKGAISVLSRLSAGGVDPYTVIVGQLVCSNFRLDSRAMARLKKAIMNLKSMKAMGNMLHFGFGIDSIVRNLASTVEGGILVALCAAVQETYSDDQAANILWELVRTFDPPEKRTPSPMQWQALINACAGTLAETEFPKLTEHLMQLHGGRNRLQPGLLSGDSAKEVRGLSSPDSLAEALSAIGRITTGALLSISISGGPDAGWLAAVAQYIFNLRVSVFDINGDLVHATAAQQHTQVLVYFTEPASSPNTTTLSVENKVYHLRDVTKMFIFNPDALGTMLVSGRVPWDRALNLTFGGYFTRLMQAGSAVSSALAAAGRVFDGVAKSQKPVAIEERQHCGSYYDDVRGHGFSRYVLSLFPELGTPPPTIHSVEFGTLKEAFDQYEASSVLIKKACGCLICERDADDAIFQDKFCLLILFETIIFIARFMSGVSAPETLLPMRSGIEAHYHCQANLHLSDKYKSRLSKYGAATGILDSDAWVRDEWETWESVAVPRLMHALLLYTGRDIQRSGHFQVAISKAGVVAFLNTLLDNGAPVDPESAGRCTIMPGQIDMHGRPYHWAEDLDDHHLHGMDYRRQQGMGQLFDSLVDPTDLTDAFDTITMIAQEHIQVVRIGLAVHERQQKDELVAKSIIIGPARLNSYALEATGIVDCNAISCKRRYSLSDLLAVDECVKLISNEKGCAVWLFAGNDLSRLVALTRAGSRTMHHPPYVILHFGECLDCCIEAAQQSKRDIAIIITRKRSVSGQSRRLRTEEILEVDATTAASDT